MRILFSFLILLLLTGCALYSDYQQGRRALEREEYDEAIVLFKRALETSPGDAKIITEIGVAYFKKDDLQNAAQYLEKARSIDSNYGKPYFYLGMVYEKQDDFQKAISEYSAYYQKFPLTKTGLSARARIGIIMRKQITGEIQEAIRKERELAVASIPENSIAVSYFSNLTDDESLAPLVKGLADIMIVDLSKVESLRVMERMRLDVIMKELALGASDLVEESSATRVGKILGARRIINGGIALPQKNLLRIDALATNIVTDWTDAHADVMDNQDRFFQMEKDLVFAILDDLGIEISREEREEIQKVPTESFTAFLAYSLGLDYEDRGMYGEAAKQFRKAIQIDPGFSLADDRLQNALLLFEMPMTGDIQEIAQMEQAYAVEEVSAERQAGEETRVSSGDRLRSVSNNSTDGFLPDTDATTSDERTTPEQQKTTTVNVIAEW